MRWSHAHDDVAIVQSDADSDQRHRAIGTLALPEKSRETEEISFSCRNWIQLKIYR